MAQADSDLSSEQELTCSICLDLFSEPVSMPCGHNFCQACIGGYWASTSVCTCPLCKRVFEERPELSINRRLLGKTELDLQTCIDKRNAQLTELKSKLHALQAELSEVEQLLSDVTHSVDRIRSELVGGIEEKREAVIGRGQSIVTQLQTKLTQLQERRGRLEAQAISDDHIGFLQPGQVQRPPQCQTQPEQPHLKVETQSFEEANSPLQDSDMDMHEVDELTLRFSLGDVKAALGEIRERLDDIRFGEVHYRHSDLRKLKIGHKKVKNYLEDVTLNPTTAYPFLILSEDRKQLKRGEKLQFYRNSSQRFDVWSCVLAKDGYESGRHYWEVNVGENKDWKLGAVRESSQRKGLFDMTPAVGYYALWWSGNHLRALTAPPLAKVKVTGHLRRVGIYLDCDEGQLVFYNAKTGSEVYSFTAAFSEKLFPLFGTGDKDVPLVLMSPFVSVPE
ncbi:E3 ubiquitin-protein ligase TRIM39 [Labeo rohita]|uniref:E3 ubiquitin-protein ligase TRIM39 n=1 Tax=Labeo rohita TaxID=84645 RepID=A0ABQ8L198_LABRO|nr:E3 ubiquitin-protein ligase TRIM39 [Labeo rohita]